MSEFEATFLPEVSDEIIKQRTEDFWLWSEPDCNSQAILQCAIDEICKGNEDDMKSFWTSLMLNIDKIPDLKEAMIPYIHVDIEAGNDSWL